jgi:Phage gp6-like head-tail connector protein
MPNRIQVFVDEADALLNAGMYDAGAIVRLHFCATETGAYANVGTAPLVTGTKVYTLYDSDGTGSTWYKTRFENAGGSITSDWSAVFQVGGEEAGYLCSLADVKQRLNIDATDTKDDEWLHGAIVAVTDEIESVTGRRFRPDPASGTKTVYLDYHGDGRTLWFPKGIRSVTYLGYATEDQPDGTGTYTEITTGYYVDPPEHERDPGWPGTRITLGWTTGQRFYWGRRSVMVTGAFSWAAVPTGVRSIAEMMVVSAFKARSAGGTSTFTIGTEGERTFVRQLTTANIPLLNWYRDVSFSVVGHEHNRSYPGTW